MNSSTVDEIKNKLDIVDVIKDYIKLEKAGINYRAKCPFHAEKSPSFFVSPSRQIWHCFGGCGIGGDMFKFVMEIEGIDFVEALNLLAKKAGVEVKKQNPQVVSEKHKLLKISEVATLFFQAQMKSVIGGEVKEYLKGRGINEESINKWRIGYAPNAWSNLSDFLISKGYSKKDIVKVGLASEKDGKIFDRFRSRIIFPIFDLQNQIIGFGGRIFKVEDPAKYLNSPATVLYDKSKVLYGLNNAKIEIRKQDSCVLVEGYTDVILSHQAGIENTIATSGTALTLDQLDILKRYTNNLITSFDMDSAGNSATTRGINLAQAKGFDIRVVSMVPGKDPADVVKESPEEWKNLIKNNKSITEFYFDVAFGEGQGPFSPEKKKEISEILLPVIKRIENKIEQSHWVQELSSRLGVKEEHIEEELKKVKTEEVKVEEKEEVKHVHKSINEQLEETLLSILIKYPEKANLIEDSFLKFVDPKTKEFLKQLKDKGKIEENSDFINTLYLKSEIENLDNKKADEELKFCLKQIKSLNIKNLLEEKREEMKVAEYNNNEDKIEKLANEISQLTKNGQ